jgi:hypothetical protein
MALRMLHIPNHHLKARGSIPTVDKHFLTRDRAAAALWTATPMPLKDLILFDFIENSSFM